MTLLYERKMTFDPISECAARKTTATLAAGDKASGQPVSQRPRMNRHGRRGWRVLPAWLAGLIFLLAGPGNGRAIEPGMPNPPASPTVVTVGVFLANLLDLDEVTETFQVELIMVAEWDDPRLAFDPAVEGTETKIFQGQLQFNEGFAGWWPQLVIINEVGLGDISAIKIEVRPDGHVRFMEARNVTLETPMRLGPFPFDTQTLQARMVAFGNDSDQVLLEVNQRMLGATE